MAILNEPQVNVRERVYDFHGPKTMTSSGSSSGGDSITIDEVLELLRDYLKVAVYESDKTELNNTITEIYEIISQIPRITVDTELSDTSTNPVENRVITNAIANLECKIDTLEVNSDSSYFNTSKPGNVLIVTNTNSLSYIRYSWGQNYSKNVTIPKGCSMAFYVKESGYGDLYPVITSIQ